MEKVGFDTFCTKLRRKFMKILLKARAQNF